VGKEVTIDKRVVYATLGRWSSRAEDLVIELTRRALMDDGKAAAGMKPTPYWPDSQFDKLLDLSAWPI